MEIKFTVPGDPVGKMRARIFRHGNIVRGVTPAKTVNYENLVRYYALNAVHGIFNEPYKGAVRVDIMAYMPIPKSWSKKKKSQALSGELRPTTKPDCDNIVKSIFDGMNTVKKRGLVIKNGVYDDDKQVIEQSIAQFYSDDPRVEVTVTTFE